MVWCIMICYTTDPDHAIFDTFEFYGVLQLCSICRLSLIGYKFCLILLKIKPLPSKNSKYVPAK